MDVTYIVIALAVAAVLFLFFSGKKKPPPQLTDEPATKRELEPNKAPSKADKPPVREPSEAKKPSEAKPTSEAPSAEAKRPSRGEPPERESDRRSATSVARAPEAPAPESAPEPERAAREIKSLRVGLAKSRESEGFFGKLKSLFSARKQISEDIAEELEEVLLSSDVGVATTSAILERIRTQLNAGELKDEGQVWQALRAEATRILDVDGAGGDLVVGQKPTVVLFVGVNGAGKTTTIGKLATKLRAQGRTCVLAAGDTFRAAAVQQLVVWGQRVGCEVVRGKDGADPGSVIFDAIKKAQEHGADFVLADTAGRLHTKSNLMAEMQKIARTAGKALDGAPHEILLVIDATNGQNAMAQAKEFKETLALSGIVLTKLDGTAKGGVLLGISDSLKVPVRYIGLGERPDDLHEFVADDFIEALLGRETRSEET